MRELNTIYCLFKWNFEESHLTWSLCLQGLPLSVLRNKVAIICAV